MSEIALKPSAPASSPRVYRKRGGRDVASFWRDGERQPRPRPTPVDPHDWLKAVDDEFAKPSGGPAPDDVGSEAACLEAVGSRAGAVEPLTSKANAAFLADLATEQVRRAVDVFVGSSNEDRDNS